MVGAADGGKCPQGRYSPPCSEIVATVWGGDSVGGNYYNVCAKHVEDYRKGAWKTLEMYPVPVAPAPVVDPSLKPSGWSPKELDVVCATCNKRFGEHTGAFPSFDCPDSKGKFVAPCFTSPLGVEAKKQADRLAWLDDAYSPYGHGGCCVVCGGSWNRVSGPKEDDIFPIDGQRKAPKLFHLKCLEKAKDEYSYTWAAYNRWKETGELPE